MRVSQGFTVIEILVCLLVLGIMVAAALGLMLQSSRIGRHSSQLALAAVLASELAGLNRAAAAIPVPASDFPAEWDLPAIAPSSTTHPDCFVAACGPAALLQFERADWMRRAEAMLPGLRARLCRDLTPWDSQVNRYQWKCSGEAAAPLVLKIGWNSPAVTEGAVASGNASGPAAPLLVVPAE